MRLTLKLAAILVSLVIIVLAAEAGTRLRYEREEFIRDIQHEQHLLGSALVPAVELAWEARGYEAARQILEQAEHAEREVSIRLDTASPDEHRLEHTQVVGSSPGEVHTWVPVRSPDNEVQAIELSESLSGVEQRLSHSARRIFYTALLLLGAAGVSAVLLGHWLIGRPVRRLVDHAHRIAEGELSRPAQTRHDEIGILQAAMGAMVDGLDAARVRAKAEAEARALAEQAMRRKERLATIGTLAAGLAHELGTPLQVVSGRARGIASDSTTSAGSRDRAEVIREQTRRMERIVRQLLDFARAPTVAPKVVGIEELLRESYHLMQPVAEEHGSIIELSEPVPDLKVHVDPLQLSQVLTNVINNAIEAMPDGGTIRLTARADAEPPGSSGDGRFVCVDVTDNGPGIPEEHTHRVFDPFFTTKPVGQGTGLGLSVAHGVVKEHGGYFDIGPNAPRGARVSIYLPEVTE